MFHYIEDKQLLSAVRQQGGKILQDTCHILKEEFDIGAYPRLVGSGGRNLVTQNERQPIDLDYNLHIVRCENFRDCRDIKESVRKAFNKALRLHGLPDCEDSTSCLTTKRMFVYLWNSPLFSIDVCIVTEYKGSIYRLIHEKTGDTAFDKYYWNEAPNSKKVNTKADFIKRHGKWQLVREKYLELKNHYLRQQDTNHPSFICYIEAVNNVYNTRRDW